ncbi:MAG: AGE family epimerase/isomerase [Thermofilaceae archaeon]
MEEKLVELRRRLARILRENIIPFWYRTIDWRNGGYILNHDVAGKPLGKATKMVVTQARMVWYFSHLYRSRWAGREALEAAEHGFGFLKDKMWDGEYGGFFWEVSEGGDVIRDFKHLYGQAFGLYAVSEYALASGVKEARGFAGEVFEIIERAHDDAYGGFHEAFSRDWSPLQAQSPVGPTGSKTMNTHLHLMEAYMTFYELTGSQSAKQRLLEMILIMANAVVDTRSGACVDLHDSSWRPLPVFGEYRVSYGHNLEALWLTADACQLTGVPVGLLEKHFETVYDYCARYGFDHEKGGVYDSGPLNRPADRLEKVWWVQAESLVAMLYLYKITRRERYLRDFEKQLNWIEGYQVDWENGDWFEVVLPDGRRGGLKAHVWKAAYHNGRAMIKSIQVLDSLLRERGFSFDD